MSCVLECKLEDVDATAWSLHRWTPGGNVSTLRSVWLIVNVVHPAAMLPQCPVVYRVQSGLLVGHRAGAMKSDVSQVNSCTVSRALWTGALSCWKDRKVKKSPDRSRMAGTGRSCWWSKTSRYWPFAFVP